MAKIGKLDWRTVIVKGGIDRDGRFSVIAFLHSRLLSCGMLPLRRLVSMQQ